MQEESRERGCYNHVYVTRYTNGDTEHVHKIEFNKEERIFSAELGVTLSELLESISRSKECGVGCGERVKALDSIRHALSKLDGVVASYSSSVENCEAMVSNLKKVCSGGGYVVKLLSVLDNAIAKDLERLEDLRLFAESIRRDVDDWAS